MLSQEEPESALRTPGLLLVVVCPSSSAKKTRFSRLDLD